MDLPPTSPESNPTPDSGRTRSSRMAAGMLGAVVGMGALVGTMAVVAGAGAQSSPAPAEETEPTGVVAESDAVEADELMLDDPELETFFVCVDEAFAAAMAAEEGDSSMSDEELDALYDAAEEQAEACESELPEGVDFDAIEEGFEAEFGDMDDIEMPEVVVETADGLELIDFGEGDGTVTITKSGDEITVAVDGDATAESIDWAAIDEWDEVEDLDELDDMDEEDDGEDDGEDDADDEMDGDADDVEEEDAETTS